MLIFVAKSSHRFFEWKLPPCYNFIWSYFLRISSKLFLAIYTKTLKFRLVNYISCVYISKKYLEYVIKYFYSSTFQHCLRLNFLKHSLHHVTIYFARKVLVFLFWYNLVIRLSFDYSCFYLSIFWLQVLYEEWARPGLIVPRKWKSDDRIAALIRQYYGLPVAVYFRWLRYYTIWLVGPAIAGLVWFLYGLITTRYDVPT